MLVEFIRVESRYNENAGIDSSRAHGDRFVSEVMRVYETI